MTCCLSFSECRFVAVDMAGHGLSSHRPPGVLYSFPYYVMDMRRVIDGMKFKCFPAFLPKDVNFAQFDIHIFAGIQPKRSN